MFHNYAGLNSGHWSQSKDLVNSSEGTVDEVHPVESGALLSKSVVEFRVQIRTYCDCMTLVQACE